MLAVIHLTTIADSIIQHILALLQLPAAFGIPILSGLFEMTLGSQFTSQADASILQQAMVTSFILAFSGLSVQAQVASILAETDIRFKPYFIARLLQSILAPCLTYILWKPLYQDAHSLHPSHSDIPVFLHSATTSLHYLHTYGPLITLLFLYVYVVLLCFKIR
jgi:nucleoside recognition membrane protein YjiH